MADNILDSGFESLSDDVFDQLMGDGAAAQVQPEPAKQDPPKSKDKPEDKDTPTPPVTPPEKTDEEVSIDVDGTFDEDEDAEPGDPESSEQADNTGILRAQFEGLVKRGIWQDFDGSDEFEFTEDSFGELTIAQAQWRADDMFNELLDQSGPYGKAIIAHIKEGGNPDDVLNIFKESKKVNSVDVSTEDGQQAMIRNYYTSVLGWSEARVTKHINRLVDSDKDALKEEAEDVKGLYEKDLQKQLQEVQREQAEAAEAARQAQQQFASTMEATVKARKDITDREQKQLLADLLAFDKKLPDGRPTNQFTLDYMKLKSDPAKYVELLMFVRDPEKYMKRVAKTTETEVKKQTWEFIKNSGSVRKGGGSHVQQSKQGSKDLVIPKDFFRNI